MGCCWLNKQDCGAYGAVFILWVVKNKSVLGLSHWFDICFNSVCQDWFLSLIEFSTDLTEFEAYHKTSSCLFHMGEAVWCRFLRHISLLSLTDTYDDGCTNSCLRVQNPKSALGFRACNCETKIPKFYDTIHKKVGFCVISHTEITVVLIFSCLLLVKVDTMFKSKEGNLEEISHILSCDK